MKRRSLLLGAAALGCGHRTASSSALAGALLELSTKYAQTSESERAWASAELGRLAAHVGERQRSGATAARALTQTLFEDLGFVREVESTALEFVLLPQVLQNRRGSCVGLGSLYLCLAEVSGFQAYGVLRPGHFFVRQLSPGPVCNVELLRRGELMPDTWYEQRFPVSQHASTSYGRGLTRQEVAGVVSFNVGNERRRQQAWDAAERAYADAINGFPTFAEAHASLGSVQHLLGKPRAAAEHYARALELDHTLPGVAENLRLLSLNSDNE